MFVSYENDEIRECCLLLRPGSVNSSFSTDEIKEIRAIIADLKAAPKLVDTPLDYSRQNNFLTFQYSTFKIICKITSIYENPLDNQIERIMIVKIINKGLQQDLTKQENI